MFYACATAGEIDPDSAIVPVDELAAQALEVQAEDMALEDTLYALQKAFQGGHLDATTYLRQVSARTHRNPPGRGMASCCRRSPMHTIDVRAIGLLPCDTSHIACVCGG